MRIEELILEGFKSYPVRTTINGWDSSFNAITGLNGSGKSNILDAICFVLGITNMTSVRASNLLDLIYKRGQAGVTKASVTIVFDNSERATSPVGFEDKRQITVTRQIAVGGLTKYLLNGHKTTLQVLQNLFQSVQLNINNPNFLIMQGKITKVLNMKPQEILGMVEEAAGTRMFEERKDKAVKTMAKKDKKVAEMESLLTEEIMPKLDALRNEKRSFLAFQKATSELERLLRLVKAYEWLEASKREAKSGETLETKKASLEEKKQLIVWLGKKQTKMEKEMGEILKKREKEMAKGGKLAGLMNAVKTLGLDIEKLKTQLEIKTKAISEEEDRLKAIEQTMSEIDSSRSSRSTKAESSTSAYDALKASFDATQAKLASDEELLQTLLTGLSSNSSSNDENAAGGYMGQLAEAKARLAAAGTEGERARVEIGLGEKELKAMEPRAKKAASEGEGLGRELVEAKAEVEKLRKGLEGLGWDEEEEKALLAKREEVRGRIAELVEKRDSLRSRLAQTDFSYNDPHPNFDRSKVKGLVVNLIDLTPENYASSTALEICAGGKLYNVIVQDEKVATSLLGNKQSLKKRVTLLPLNKIQAASVPKEKLAAAEKIAPNKVQTAISLVGYDDELSTAMSFVFGSTLICTDAEAASAITFNKSILLKSITLDGDVYDPSGMLSGGSAPKGGGVLVQVQKIREVERELEGLWTTERELEGKLAKAKGVIEKFRKGKRELEIKQHEVGLLEEQVNGSNAAKIIAEVDALKANVLKLKDVIAQSRDKQNQAKADVKRLEKEMDDFKNNKDSKLNEIKASIVSQKKLVTKQSGALKAAQKDMQTAQLELEQLDQDLSSAAAEIEEVQSNLRRARSELAALEKETSEVQSRYQTADAHLKSELATLAQFDEELNSLETDIKHKKDELTNVNLEVQKLDHEIVSATAERTKLRNRVSDLERTFTWIKDEHKSFGQPGSIYDFTKFDLATSRERVAELEEQQRGMKKKINPKVMTLIDNVEKKETALKKMMATVIKDKAKIEETITELDRYKRDALKTTWSKVNGDFGSIFAELLPGNFAKLQPPEGMDITEGLEVKIRLGSVWKASLTELSGGQRSLIALSLIMSLLQFKPAPMYILDEIDAALDLSHTQHIGSLFRNRFKGSQFIVVSLKEGLFTNANVLFKAKFVDGTSTVERTVTRSSNTFHQKTPAAAAAATAPSRTSLANNAASRSRPAAAVPPTPTVGEEDETMAFDDGQEYSQFSQPTRKTPLVGR